MATLPDVSGPRAVAQPSRGLASISPGAAGAVGNAVKDLGQTTNLIGMQILDKEATAAAKDADTQAGDKIRSLLYDPETGFANLRGADAVNARRRVSDQLDAITATSLEGLNGAARRKAQDSLTMRKERALMTIDTHTSDQRQTWIAGARDARIQSAAQDVLADPASINASLNTINGEILGRAKDEGWDIAKTNLELGRAQSTIYRGVAEKIAMVDPEGATAYLQQNRSKMLGTDVTDLEAKLIPLAKDAEGRRMGAAAAGGNGGYAPPSGGAGVAADAMRAISKGNPIAAGINSAAAALGVSPLDLATAMSYETGGTMDPTQGGPTTQWGQHRGLIQFGEPQAAQFGADFSSPESAVTSQLGPNGAVVQYLKAAGVRPGMGLLDIYSAINAGGVGRYGASDANNGGAPGTVADKVAGMAGHQAKAAALLGWEKTDGAPDISSILNITDPTVREAALKEFTLRQTIASNQAKAATSAAAQAAFGYVESGGSLNNLTVAERTAIGETGMSSLRTYEAKVKAGVPVETDVGTYAALRSAAVTNPAQFGAAAANGFADFADKLSPSDRKSLVDIGTKPVNPADQQSASSLMSVATAQLRGLGIKSGDSKEALVQSNLLNWQADFKKTKGTYPTQLETDQQVGREMMAVIVNPPGYNLNNYKGNVFDAGGVKTVDEILKADALTIGDKQIPPGTAEDMAAAMTARGMVVTPQSLMEQLALFAESKL